MPCFTNARAGNTVNAKHTAGITVKINAGTTGNTDVKNPNHAPRPIRNARKASQKAPHPLIRGASHNTGTGASQIGHHQCNPKSNESHQQAPETSTAAIDRKNILFSTNILDPKRVKL